MIQTIGFEDTAAATPEAREVISVSASRHLVRRGRRYLLRFTSPIEREFELTAEEAFRWCEWCGALEPFADMSREDLVRDAFHYQWRGLLAAAAMNGGRQ